MYLAYDYPVLGIFWTVLFVTVAVMWFILLVRVIADIFRNHAMGGLAKTGWLLCVLILPFLGVFMYILAHGDRMSARDAERDAELRRTTTGSTTATTSADIDDLAKLADLKAHGDITEADYARAKEKILH
ncbi:SHOCT domain-containing protein [Streptomyces sp. NPDC051976]|uniref:SHOCT domain-containing protein n=1 Tax=Streptomyces sp. NPDC051976 TaxID=3154947 RepID=UPI00343129C5